MKTALVLHADPPNFFAARAQVPANYKAVARWDCIDGRIEDDTVLEDLFRLTNSIEHPWFSVAAGSNISVPIDDTAKPLGQRSTSTGDVVRITDESGDRYFLCEMVGWAPIDEALVTCFIQDRWTTTWDIL